MKRSEKRLELLHELQCIDCDRRLWHDHQCSNDIGAIVANDNRYGDIWNFEVQLDNGDRFVVNGVTGHIECCVNIVENKHYSDRDCIYYRKHNALDKYLHNLQRAKEIAIQNYLNKQKEVDNG